MAAAALLTAPAGAAPDLFAGADALREKASRGVRNGSIDPVWLDGGAQLWFRTVSAAGAGEFHLVDARSGERRPLFDHTALTTALTSAGVPAASATGLRLDEVKVESGPLRIGFALEGKRWLWNADTGMLQSGEAAGGGAARPVPRRSGNGGPEMHFTLKNSTGAQIRLWWLNAEGRRQAYGGVNPGASSRFHTFAGHVWLITDADDGELTAFEATTARTEIEVKGKEEIRWAEPERRRRRGGDAESDGAPENPTRHSDRSPDGKASAFVRDHNLFLKTADGKETALTTDGTEEDRYEGPFLWSPDSRRLVAMRMKPVTERQVTVVRSSPKDQLQPKVETWDYAKPGDPLAQRRPRMFDAVNAKALPVDDALCTNSWSVDEWHWARDSSAFHYLFNQRGHQLLRIVAMDAETGASRPLHEEKAETFVDYSQKTWLRWLDDTDEFLWTSERDGWNHLYLCDARTGAVKKQLTSGEWVLRNVTRVDTEKRQVWFRCMSIHPAQDPYHMHFARVNMDGTGLTVLTEGDGTHEIAFAPDRETFVATWSRADHAPVQELRRSADGKLLCTLNQADISALTADGWPMPQRFSAKGRDGKTDICGLILRPHGFDPAKKYPVIEYIYAGPHDFFVPKEFRAWNRHWELGNLGFILVFIDGMGTNWRSRAFHDVAWKNIGDAGFPDRIAWMKAAAAQHPEMDLTRVGIYGGSAGGQNAMRALIAHGDFYHAAAADCGCHDNRMDKIWWNEAWMGYPIGDHYRASSNVEQAHRLKGHLLLSVGEVDSNVDPASTMQVVNALIKANKDFDLLVIPNANHGAGESPWAHRRRAQFFQRHLLGVQPQAN